VALPFVLNLLFNFAFTPIQFGLKNNLLAAVELGCKKREILILSIEYQIS
jgi:tryptophan-rich sensory protein